MTPYTAYNLAFAAFTLPVSYWLVGLHDRRRKLLLSARIALLLTVLYFPWDFFAIRLGVWTYPNHPGFRVHDVPLNDLIFIWLCSYLTCAVLIAVARWRRRGHGHSQGEKADSKNAGDE
jgi:lycopene cyclase domain-containing protein